MEILKNKEVILSKSKEELQQYAEDIYIYIMGLDVIRYGQNKILKEQKEALEKVKLNDTTKNDIFHSLINAIETQRNMIYELSFMKTVYYDVGLIASQENTIKAVLNNANKKLKLDLDYEIGF